MIQEKILVVEDDIQIQNFMVYTLENAGFEVAAVPSGKEAIECSCWGMPGFFRAVRALFCYFCGARSDLGTFEKG